MPTPPPPSTTTSTPPPAAPDSNLSSSSFPFPPYYSFPPFFTRQPNQTTHFAQLTKWSSLVLSYCRHHRIFKLLISSDSVRGTTTSTAAAAVSAAAASASASTEPGATTTATSSISTREPPPSLLLSSPDPSSSGPPTVDATELFFNRRIGRRLGLADIREVLDFLRRDGRAEFVSPSSSFSSASTANRGSDGAGFGAGTSAAAGDFQGGAGSAGGGDVVWIYWRTPEEWAALVEGWVDATGQKGSVLTVYELVEGDGTRGTEFHGLDQDLLLKALNVLVKRGKAQVFGQEGSQGVKFF